MAETVIPPAQAMQSLLESVLKDADSWFPNVRFSEDAEYIRRRCNAEGPRFLLITLPELGKAIEVALIRSEPLKVPMGWRLAKNERLPLFLHSLFSRVFDHSGAPLRSGDANAVLLLRQCTLMFSKVEGTVSDEMIQRDAAAFAARVTERRYPERDPLIQEARRILHRLFDAQSAEVQCFHDFNKNPWGRHGPGAVAGRERGGEKWDFFRWPELPERLFRVNERSPVIISGGVDRQPVGRVTNVPKDFRKSRVISIEPKENQFAQQGLMDLLYRFLSTHFLTRRSISFRSVDASRRLCYDPNIGTIDLKDASDRLNVELCRLLLPRWFFRLVTRYRTRQVKVLDEVVRPRCFATMGSAVCFPIQTVIFWALAQSVYEYGRKASSLNRRGPVRVYGDDIIVPTWAMQRLETLLTNCGLVVNPEKTCHSTSLIRESCGEWVYHGDKTPRHIPLIRPYGIGILDACSWAAWRDLKIQAEGVGFANLTQTISSMLDAYYTPRVRFNPPLPDGVRLQKMMERIPVFVTQEGRAHLSGYAGLYAYFVKNDITPVIPGHKPRKRRVKWIWNALR